MVLGSCFFHSANARLRAPKVENRKSKMKTTYLIGVCREILCISPRVGVPIIVIVIIQGLGE